MCVWVKSSAATVYYLRKKTQVWKNQTWFYKFGFKVYLRILSFIWGHSTTTWTKFYIFLTPFSPLEWTNIDILHTVYPKTVPENWVLRKKNCFDIDNGLKNIFFKNKTSMFFKIWKRISRKFTKFQLNQTNDKKLKIKIAWMS